MNLKIGPVKYYLKKKREQKKKWGYIWEPYFGGGGSVKLNSKRRRERKETTKGVLGGVLPVDAPHGTMPRKVVACGGNYKSQDQKKKKHVRGPAEETQKSPKSGLGHPSFNGQPSGNQMGNRVCYWVGKGTKKRNGKSATWPNRVQFDRVGRGTVGKIRGKKKKGSEGIRKLPLS